MEGRLGGVGDAGQTDFFIHHGRTHVVTAYQGKGAFGSVVKARNKIDSRIYAGAIIELYMLQISAN